VLQKGHGENLKLKTGHFLPLVYEVVYLLISSHVISYDKIMGQFSVIIMFSSKLFIMNL